MKKIKDVILDTDLGVDCDDATALGILLNAHNSGKCNLIGITASTTREGATATGKIISDYYGVNPPIGVLKSKVLECDKTNNYAIQIKNTFNENDVDVDALILLRKLLAKAEEKIDIIAIGPLTNIADLLKSTADEFSSLDGVNLMKEKVENLFVMGGNFEGCFAEWNILQDIESAQVVSELCPCRIVFCPHEVGNKIFTKMMGGPNPVWLSMKYFANSNHESYEPSFYRQSWDPSTVLLALNTHPELFDLSNKGRVKIGDKGYTHFEEYEFGNAQFVTTKSNLKEIEKIINENIELKSMEAKHE